MKNQPLSITRIADIPNTITNKEAIIRTLSSKLQREVKLSWTAREIGYFLLEKYLKKNWDYDKAEKIILKAFHEELY